ncbi:MAG: hypothetical protein VKL41_19675 [Snowella sp.]|nr:hypothetical protein [Snowella sp.]
MNALILKILPILVYISVLIPVICSAQFPSTSKTETSDKMEVSETIKRQLSLQKPNQEADIFIISGPKQRVDKAASIGTIIYVAGVNKEAVNSAIEFVLAGADPESVGNLMLSTNGLLPKNQSANITKFNQALESYNKIIDLADEATLQSLENNPNFVAIGQLLKEMRKAVP